MDKTEQPIAFSEFVQLSGAHERDLFEHLCNDQIAALTGMEPKRILQSTGMDSRYIMRKEKHPIDLARRAIQRFLEQSKIASDQIGGLALSHTAYDKSITQEMADVVAREQHLPLENVLARSYGCAGFPDIIQAAAPLVRRLSPEQHCLVLNIETPQRNKDARDKFATPIFAAGATATSLWKGPGHTVLFADVDDIVPTNNPGNEKFFTMTEEPAQDYWGGVEVRIISHMNGNLVYTNGLETIERAARESLERVLAMGCLDRRIVVVPHQPNGKMVKMFVDVDGPAMEKENAGKVRSVEWVNGMNGMGNTISATIPSVLARVNSLLKIPPQKDDIVLIPAAGICIADPEDKMSVGRGAMIWNPGGYRTAI